MPRTRQGGARQGKPGANYPNRTDMQLAPRAAPGQSYGAAAEQLRGQEAVPMGAPPTAVPPVGGGAPAGEVPMPPPPTPLAAPTGRPDEPITAGLAMGAGAGPEALGMEEVDPDMMTLIQQLPALEKIASLPGSSIASRNMVRRLRASVPPNMTRQGTQ